MRRIRIAVMVAAAMAVSCFAGAAQASEAQPRVQNITGDALVCLTNASTACMDIKDNVKASGQPVWVFSKSGGNALQWNLTDADPNVCDGQASCGGVFTPFTVHSFDNMYFGDTIEVIGVEGDPSLCVGESGGSVFLRSTECANDRNTFWVVNGNQLINVASTDSNDLTNVLTAVSSANEATIEVEPPGDFGTFQKWTQSPA